MFDSIKARLKVASFFLEKVSMTVVSSVLKYTRLKLPSCILFMLPLVGTLAHKQHMSALG